MEIKLHSFKFNVTCWTL